MFLLGGIQNTKGLVLEHVQRDIDINLGQVGTIIAVFQTGFMLASLVAGYLTDKRGLKATMLLGALLMAGGLVGTSLAHTAAVFLAFYLVIGLGIGAMLVAIVTIIPTFYKARAGMMFNVSNAMFGVGMIVMPLVLQALFVHRISWRGFYVLLAGVVVSIIAILAVLRVQPSTGSEVRPRDVVAVLANADVAIVVLFLLCYVAAEAAFLNFFPIFYGSLNIAGASIDDKAATAAYVISSFALVFTIGRFLGGAVTTWCNPHALLMLLGSTITAPLLKMICSSSPSSWMACRTNVSLGSQVATMLCPTVSGCTPSSLRRATNAGDGGSATSVSRCVAGLNRSAPFSATTQSKSSNGSNTLRKSGRSRPVTRISLRPDVLICCSAATVDWSTRPSRARVPS